MLQEKLEQKEANNLLQSTAKERHNVNRPCFDVGHVRTSNNDNVHIMCRKGAD